MNTLTRWDPFKEMDDMQKRLSNLFGLRVEVLMLSEPFALWRAANGHLARCRLARALQRIGLSVEFACS